MHIAAGEVLAVFLTRARANNSIQSNVTYPTTSGLDPCWKTEYVGKLTPYFYVGLLCIAACTCIVLLDYILCSG